MMILAKGTLRYFIVIYQPVFTGIRINPDLHHCVCVLEEYKNTAINQLDGNL
ncbi:hypothetical protein J2S36_000904 [Arcanobacterium hippocoleae]|uniref:Uncharacterized protein n=1 Tax=Arcanobacterium hippocoleae TaxID=149017 RepID=A0ABU1T3B9_9ACTO|nr:hypothetical protein [Arcanobacterium hippocoleae]